MPSTLIGEDYVTKIRSSLGVTSDDLTTDEIDARIEAIEEEIKETITNYTSLAGKDLTYLKAGTVAAVAAEMCPILKVKLPDKEKTLNTETQSSVDWDKRKEQLETESARWLNKITGNILTYTPTFGASGPTRAGDGLFSE